MSGGIKWCRVTLFTAYLTEQRSPPLALSALQTWTATGIGPTGSWLPGFPAISWLSWVSSSWMVDCQTSWAPGLCDPSSYPMVLLLWRTQTSSLHKLQSLSVFSLQSSCLHSVSMGRSRVGRMEVCVQQKKTNSKSKTGKSGLPQSFCSIVNHWAQFFHKHMMMIRKIELFRRWLSINSQFPQAGVLTNTRRHSTNTCHPLFCNLIPRELRTVLLWSL